MTSPWVRRVQSAFASVPPAYTVLVAIDGRAASGKTTLANELGKESPHIRILHADELQRPQAEGEWDNWTPRECATNFVKEEALRHVLSKLITGRQAVYEPFDWTVHKLRRPMTLSPEGIIVIEGAYTLRKSIRNHFDVKVWVDCDEQVRMARIRAQPTPSPGWREAWTRGEDFYLEHERPSLAADVVVRGDPQ